MARNCPRDLNFKFRISSALGSVATEPQSELWLIFQCCFRSWKTVTLAMWTCRVRLRIAVVSWIILMVKIFWNCSNPSEESEFGKESNVFLQGRSLARSASPMEGLHFVYSDTEFRTRKRSSVSLSPEWNHNLINLDSCIRLPQKQFTRWCKYLHAQIMLLDYAIRTRLMLRRMAA